MFRTLGLPLGAAALAAIALGLRLVALWVAPAGMVIGMPWAFGVAAGVALARSAWTISLSR